MVGRFSTGAPQRFDVAVVGAGQAGLAAGYFLSKQDRSFVILDSAQSLGAAWAARWASLTLFTPRRADSLPGLAFPGEPDGYPGRDEVVSYLDLYARTFALPVQFGSRVWSMTKDGERFALELADRTIEADAVVVATGPFQTPRVPRFAADLAPGTFQIHSGDYNAPEEIPTGTVLVVGGGNTGFQIASELSSTHEVHLSVGSRQRSLPQRFLGRDLFWWLRKTGLLSTTVESRRGRRLSSRDALIGSSRRALRRQGVTLAPRATGASGTRVTLADETELSVDAVIWATGFELDHSWIQLPAPTAGAGIGHHRGVSDIPGLYFLGLPWQHTRGSALLGWVKDDAEHIAAQIAATPPHRSAVETAGGGDDADGPLDLLGVLRHEAADRRAHERNRARLVAERKAAEADRRVRAEARVPAREAVASAFDELTGAYLPAAGFAELDREMARSRRTGQPLTLLTVDVDELETVGEAWGRGAADRLVAEVADTVRSRFRPYDVVIRARADEFVCVIAGMGMADAAKRLERVNAALGETHGAGWLARTGIAELQDGDSREDVVSRAAVAVR